MAMSTAIKQTWKLAPAPAAPEKAAPWPAIIVVVAAVVGLGLLALAYWAFSRAGTAAAQAAQKEPAREEKPVSQKKEAPAPAPATATKAPPAKPKRRELTLYERTLLGTVWIKVWKKGRPSHTGTGWVADARRGLIVTNHHVAANYERVQVYFPKFRGGRPVSEPDQYTARDAVPARVIDSHPNKDLAVLRVGKMPARTRELKFAASPPRPSDRLHLVGNPGASQGLWVYTTGTVRQLVRNWKGVLDSSQVFQGSVIEAQMAINGGDSGSAVVNDAGEVVGVAFAHKTAFRNFDLVISAPEARRMLAEAKAVLAAGGRNLLANGDFEQGGEVNELNTVKAGERGIPGWAVTHGDVDLTGTYWQAASGRNSVDLHGFAPGGISQSFATTPGKTYLVSFRLGGNPEGAVAKKELGVAAAGVGERFLFDAAGTTKARMHYDQVFWRFRATEARTTLKFFSLMREDAQFGPVLDDIRVIEVP